MGCCHSTNNAALSQDEGQPSINSNDGTSNNPRGTQAAPQPPQPASNQAYVNRDGPNSHLRPNNPIRSPSPLPRSPKNVSNRPPPWTRSHLEQQRSIYFETRVQGDPVVWATLRAVSDLIREGKIKDAQAMLTAADMTCPQGRVAKGKSRVTRDTHGRRIRGGVYDANGVLYEVPEWCLAYPEDLVEDDEQGRGVEKDMETGASSDGTRDSDDEGGPEAVTKQKSREEKGKGRAEDVGEEIQVKARLSNTSKDVIITMGSRQPVRIAAQRIRDQLGVGRVRLMYLGKELDENKTLAVHPAHTLNAFVWEE